MYVTPAQCLCHLIVACPPGCHNFSCQLCEISFSDIMFKEATVALDIIDLYVVCDITVARHDGTSVAATFGIQSHGGITCIIIIIIIPTLLKGLYNFNKLELRGGANEINPSKNGER